MPTLDTCISLIKESVKSSEDRKISGVNEAKLSFLLGSDFTPLKPKNVLGMKSIPIRERLDEQEWAKRQEAAALLIESGKSLPKHLQEHAASSLRGESKSPPRTVN